VCAGNIMLLDVSQYAGATESLFGHFFDLLMGILFLPILLYSAIPFYFTALADIRQRSISIDLPIALAIIGGGSIGYYHLFQGHGDLYFDSLSLLVFLLLSSRYFLSQLHKKYLSPEFLKSFISQEIVIVIENGQQLYKKVSDLKTGDLVYVQQNEVIPVDGTLHSVDGYVNSAILTGEARAEKKRIGENVFAGTTWLSESTIIKVEAIGNDTRMGQIFQSMEKELLVKTPLIALTDRAARYFTFSILTAGILFFIGYSFVDPTEAISRSLALIILACPCALALATPLTQGLGLMKAAQLGIIIKNANSLEKLQKVKNVILDKTGTLTFGHLRPTTGTLNHLSNEDQIAIFSLEQKSHHPVAFALREMLPQPTQLMTVENYKEIPEGGVEGLIDGHHYSCRKSLDKNYASENLGTKVDILKDGKSLAQIEFADEVRTYTKASIEQLKALSMEVYLLTGDLSGPALSIGKVLDIPESHIFSSKSPEEKNQFVKSLQNTMMVGDGVNDSVALAASDVGVSVHGSMKASLAASDIYLTSAGIQLLAPALMIAQETYKVIKSNLILSIVYNTIFGIAALAGYVNPLVAAILMPISSITVLLSSLWGTRKLRELTQRQNIDENKEKQNSFFLPKEVRS
ncbi:MAG: heavy metal translocating P-type ATPase, partial [Bdellovibrionales bacterium]|nr:heavy metal translocating P-type ATPase [Bdellovibrionales bacterium]